LESPASPAAALRVALHQLFVGETPKSLTFLSLKSIRPGFVGVEALGFFSIKPALSGVERVAISAVAASL
jgi:hypothetical protein